MFLLLWVDRQLEAAGRSTANPQAAQAALRSQEGQEAFQTIFSSCCIRGCALLDFALMIAPPPPPPPPPLLPTSSVLPEPPPELLATPKMEHAARGSFILALAAAGILNSNFSLLPSSRCSSVAAGAPAVQSARCAPTRRGKDALSRRSY